MAQKGQEEHPSQGTHSFFWMLIIYDVNQLGHEN
jgi:hypothetical protein